MTGTLSTDLRRWTLAAVVGASSAMFVHTPVYAAAQGDVQTTSPSTAGPAMSDGIPAPNTVHQGVIVPPAVGDSEINKGAPPAGDFPTPVIRPPGTPGGKPNPVTK